VIKIDISHDKDCPAGRYITQMKTSLADKRFITTAAELVGMTHAQFLRTVAFQAACAIHNWPDTQGSEPEGDSSVAPKRNAAA
jgi:hypothetical protein